MTTAFSGRDWTRRVSLISPQYAVLDPTDVREALEGGVVINPAG
jgi:hypothetical protein